MKHIKLVIALILFPAFLHSQTNRDSIRATISTLEEGLKNKDVELVRKTFSGDISISTNMGTGTNSLLGSILQNIAFESVELLSDTLHQDKDATYAKVKFVTKQGKPQESIVVFDNDNKILFIDYFDRLFGQSRYRESSLVAVIPFSRDSQYITLSVRLNNNPRLLSFALDTGANGMAIKKSVADALGMKPDYAQQTNVVGGQTQVNMSTGNTVHLTDSLSLPQQNIAIFDEIHGNLDGIIGLNLIKRYITKIDFDNRKLYLYNFGNFHYADNGTIIPVKMRSGLIAIPSVLNLTGKEALKANFLLDMGADYKLIVFSDFVRENQLETGFQAESVGTTVSLGHSTPVYHGKAHELKVGGIVSDNLPVTLQVSGLNNQSQSNGIDGSIGVQFWAGYNVVIDLLRKEIHLVPREQPTDRATGSNSSILKEYDYAVIADIKEIGRMGTLIDVENNLYEALTYLTKLRVISASEINSLPDTKKQKVLFVRYSGRHNDAESIVNIYFDDCLTGRRVVHCKGVYNLGFSKEHDAKSAMYRALAKIVE